MTKLLIAVASCRRDQGLHDSIRIKWVPFSDVADTRFFTGYTHSRTKAAYSHKVVHTFNDRICLDTPDEYFDLPLKVQAICFWALEHNYSYLFKIDCDTVPDEKRFRAFDYTKYDYAGSCFPRDHYPPVHCSGFGYFLSRKAMQIVADFDVSGYQFEDRMVGDALRPHIIAGRIKQHNIKWMVAAAGESNGGEPPI